MLKRSYTILMVPVLLASCGAEPTAPEDLTQAAAIRPASPAARPLPVISDGRTDGSPTFYFLFPIVAGPAPHAQPFDQDAAPTVTICRAVNGACVETVAEFPYADQPGPRRPRCVNGRASSSTSRRGSRRGPGPGRGTGRPSRRGGVRLGSRTFNWFGGWGTFDRYRRT